MEAFGWADPIGETIQYGNQRSYTVLGVMDDFHFLTMHAPITPFALFHTASESYQIPDSYVAVRLAPDAGEAGIAALASAWEAFAPDVPFDYAFLDERLGEQYNAEQRMSRLFLVFSGLIVLLACMGLLGLVAFATEQRTKEVGIRKVLGANVASLLTLLARGYVGLIALAFALAVPIVYLAMNRWLEGFAYQTEIGSGVFLLAGAIALVLALATISGHALRAATADPIRALRSE